LRWETQNRVRDKSDWAPRLSLAYALGNGDRKRPPKTVVRAGYGWFYQRFTVPIVSVLNAGTPYLITGHSPKRHQPGRWLRSRRLPIRSLRDAVANANTAQTLYTVDPHFHAAVDMQAAVGIDRQVAKRITANITYLYGRGVHQYLTNNIGAPDFATRDQGIYPSRPAYPPRKRQPANISQRYLPAKQVIASVRVSIRGLAFSAFYSYNAAQADTNGVTYVLPSPRTLGSTMAVRALMFTNRFPYPGKLHGALRCLAESFLSGQFGLRLIIRNHR